MNKVIGFIGAGQLGEPMVLRLLAASHDVLLYARRGDVRDRLASQGAVLADSVAELARHSDILISCLFSDAQLREIGLASKGLIANAKPGAVFVSHTTGNVVTLKALADSAALAPVILDAPVSGTVDDIVAGTLTVLLGGPSDAVQMVTPVLAAYADPIVPTGELGSALALKLVNNLLFAANAQLLAAATRLAEQLGVNSDGLLSALQVCSAGSNAAAYAYRSGGMDSFAEATRPFLRKDIAAALEAAQEAGADPGLLGQVFDSGPLALRSEQTKAIGYPMDRRRRGV
jgi:3-hydroxyisobutyrate dehydrogenase-like beta-hydroxyacid dehydrogenase